MEYPHEQAVTDGVNVDFTVYKIETAITKAGSVIEAGDFAGFRDGSTGVALRAFPVVAAVRCEDGPTASERVVVAGGDERACEFRVRARA
jgi:hypothetical protein